jgi:hypothetical protein
MLSFSLIISLFYGLTYCQQPDKWNSDWITAHEKADAALKEIDNEDKVGKPPRQRPTLVLTRNPKPISS